MANLEQRARAARALLALSTLAFDPDQRRGPDGRWIDMPGVGDVSHESARSSVQRAYGERTAAIRSGVGSGIKDVQGVGRGMMGEVALVRFKDGTRAISKKVTSPAFAVHQPYQLHTPEDQITAEELTSVLAAHLGIPAPALVRKSTPDDAFIEVMPGQPAIEKYPMGPNGIQVPEETMRSRDALRMGLLDVLIDNGDRNAGNWLVDEQGSIYPIDHAMGFASRHGDKSAARGPFGSPFVNPKGGAYRARNPLTPADIEKIRNKVEAMRSAFERRGKSEWFDQMMARVDRLAAGAKGTENIL